MPSGVHRLQERLFLVEALVEPATGLVSGRGHVVPGAEPGWLAMHIAYYILYNYI